MKCNAAWAGPANGFAFQHWPDVEPDIVCCAKALSGGYVPVGAVITTPRIMDSVFSSHGTLRRSFQHFRPERHGHGGRAGEPLRHRGRQAGRKRRRDGRYVMEKLRPIAEACPFVSDVRGKGLMFGLDFARPQSSLKLKMAWDMLHKMNFGVFGQMIIIPLMERHRILTQVAGYHTEVIKFLPPMIVTKEDMDWFLTAIEDVLADVQRIPARPGIRFPDWPNARCSPDACLTWALFNAGFSIGSCRRQSSLDHAGRGLITRCRSVSSPRRSPADHLHRSEQTFLLQALVLSRLSGIHQAISARTKRFISSSSR